jgi:hypothetical protein
MSESLFRIRVQRKNSIFCTSQNHYSYFSLMSRNQIEITIKLADPGIVKVGHPKEGDV